MINLTMNRFLVVFSFFSVIDEDHSTSIFNHIPEELFRVYIPRGRIIGPKQITFQKDESYFIFPHKHIRVPILPLCSSLKIFCDIYVSKFNWESTPRLIFNVIINILYIVIDIPDIWPTTPFSEN